MIGARAAEIAGHIGLGEEVSLRVAIDAVADSRQVLAALDLCIVRPNG
jgi:hypothetical protein